ncbi:MAG: SBBP repeat-containing protein [Acidobacteria bacterium]|nr:SBBP repeat-containing protein [Acidobacteriota bacterium]
MNNPARSEFFAFKSLVCFFTVYCFGLAFPASDTVNAVRTVLQNQQPASSALSRYGQTPLGFEANRGQARAPVQFIAQGLASDLYLTPTSATLELHAPNKDRAMVAMQLVGANPLSALQGEYELAGKSNYFAKNHWTTNVPMFGRIRSVQVYRGIDLVFYGNQQKLEYDFIVQPGADPNAIRLRFDGAQSLRLDANGDLVLQTAAGDIRQHRPVVYQEINGRQQSITGHYVLHPHNQVSFALGDYDHTQTLVIDPIISYATFLGTDLTSQIALTVDKEGNAYIARNHGYEATPGAFQTGSAISVTKLDKTGTNVLYTATFGDGELDRVNGMTVDDNGNLYLVGQASSSLFPTTPGAFQPTFGLTGTAFLNAFVMKLNSQGNALVYSTFLKGETTYKSEKKGNVGKGIAVDSQGNAYIVGHTNTLDFPVSTGALQATIAAYNKMPPNDVFVTKLNAQGTGILYSTYLGSASNTESGTGIVIDAQGNAYITGFTGNGWVGITQPQGTKFPTTANAYQLQDNYGLGDFLPTYVFASKINATGNALVYSTLLGTVAGNLIAPSLALDASGCAYLTGWTKSATFPTTAGAYKTNLNAELGNAFVTKLNAAGSALVYSTFLGGSTADYGTGIGVDASGQAIVTGFTNSPDFPQIGGTPENIEYGGFIAKLNASGSALMSSSFLPGTRDPKIALDGAGNYYLAGGAVDGFQPTSGAFQSATGTSFLLKISNPRTAMTVSAASYSGPTLACEAIVSSFGTGLATVTQSANTVPLPTKLAGTTVKVKDSAGVEREAALFFVSPTQVNYQIPPNTANGTASITITSGDNTVSMSNVEIVNIAPSLFSADATGRGLAAAQIQRSGSSTMEPTVMFDPAKGQLVAIPIDLTVSSSDVYLVMYATGVRMNSDLGMVNAKVGGLAAQVSYAGAQGGFVGLDQVNVKIPRALAGQGTVDLTLSINGRAANTVKVVVK